MNCRYRLLTNRPHPVLNLFFYAVAPPVACEKPVVITLAAHTADRFSILIAEGRISEE